LPPHPAKFQSKARAKNRVTMRDATVRGVFNINSQEIP